LVKQNATFDSSFWINAHRATLLPELLDTYELHYPPEVAAELVTSFPSGREFWRLVNLGALIASAPAADQLREFGPGERAAINLALTHPDWHLLLDDQRPFQRAAQCGLRVICTPVLTVALFVEGKIDARRALVVLARLAALQTVSPNLLAAALAQLGRLASFEDGGI
jgi:hypothetical protein